MTGELTDIKYFGIVSPNMTYGEREDIPSIALPNAFTCENKNIIIKDSEIQRFKMRLPELLESRYSNGTITATNGSAVITGVNTGWRGSVATHTPYWVGRKFTITDSLSIEREYTIASVDTATQITLTENYEGATESGLDYKIGTIGQKVRTPDENPAIHYHRMVIITGGSSLEYLFVFTKAHIYLWNYAWSAFVLKFTCSSDCLMWDTAEINNQIVATNNIDKVQIWGTTPENEFANLGGASGIPIGGGLYIQKAKMVIVYENYLILGWVDVNGTTYSKSIYWAGRETTDFDQTGSTDAGAAIVEGGDSLVAFAEEDGNLIIGKEKSTHRYWLVTSSDVFNGDKINDIGWLSRRCHENDKNGRLFWLTNDFSIREVRTPYSFSKPKDKTFKEINTDYAAYSAAVFLNEYGLILFSIPVGSEATGNNKVLWFDPERGRWGELGLEVAAFGEYTRQEVYDWINLPFDSWDEWGWDNWNDAENSVGWPLNLCSDYSGYTYDLHAAQKDDGENYTGYVVLATDMTNKQALNLYKRLEEMILFFRNEGAGTAEISIKRDSESDWQSIASVSLNGNEDILQLRIGMDKVGHLRARHFLVKISGSNVFRFLGMFFGYLPDGYR
jgi:hypothetical protein